MFVEISVTEMGIEVGMQALWGGLRRHLLIGGLLYLKRNAEGETHVLYWRSSREDAHLRAGTFLSAWVLMNPFQPFPLMLLSVLC